MKPPHCSLCDKNLRRNPDEDFSLVRFKLTAEQQARKEKMKEKRMVGHPPGAHWFCEQHAMKAKALRSMTWGEAKEIIMTDNLTPKNLSKNFVHLGLGASAISQPEFSGMEWYADYGARHGSDGPEGRLVSFHSFSENWDVWEMHPRGTEVVVCTAGEITLIQEIDGTETKVKLGIGDYAINPPGVWHTADVTGSATALFITAGEGTEHKPR